MKAHVQYHTLNSFTTDCRQQLRQGGLFLRLELPAQRGQPLSVVITLPDGSSHELQGQILQVIPGQGLALDFSRSDPQRLAELLRLAESVDRAAVPEQPRPPTVELVDEADTPAAEPAATASRKSLPAQVEQMTVAQKRQAALHGKKDLRWALIRDRNKTIHPFVIKNPALTLDEVEQIAKLPSVNPEVLRQIARNREWTRSLTVCRNLVRNPKTPLKEALLLLGKLPVNELRALARSNNVRTPIQQAARKKVIG